MSVACFIPIKANSERVPGKNFRMLNGKKLYEYICEHAKESDSFDAIYVDTNSLEISEYAQSLGLNVIERKEELAKNTANGNDLLAHHVELYPQYDHYFQLFATAPYLQAATIRKCVEELSSSTVYDSCFTATQKHDFCWLNGLPINYRPDILPRSQDMVPIVCETTGLYGINREILLKHRCRIGKKPYAHIVSSFEAVDINTEEDLLLAELIGKTFYKL